MRKTIEILQTARDVATIYAIVFAVLFFLGASSGCAHGEAVSACDAYRALRQAACTVCEDAPDFGCPMQEQSR